MLTHLAKHLSWISASVLLVQGAQAQATPPPRWKGVLDLTIGGANAVGGADFGRISGIALDRAGRIFVADGQDEQISLFSPAGAMIAKIGRAGSGPLEFKGLTTIAISADQLLWVRDEGNARMIALDVTKLPPVNTKTIPLRQFTGGSRLPITFESDGSLVDESITFDAAKGTFRPLRLRRAISGDVLRTDTLAIPEGASAGVHKISVTQKDAAGKAVGMAQYYITQPHGPEWLRAYGPDGVRAEVVGSRYSVRVFGRDGALIRTLTRTVPPVPLSAREQQAGARSLKQALEKRGALASELPFGVPLNKPPVVSLTYSADGQLWVERSTADGRPREADVYDATGRWVAIAEWPLEYAIAPGYSAVINARTLLATARDSSDVERVARLRFR